MLNLTLYGKVVRLSFGGIVSKYQCRAVDGKCNDSPCRKIADGWVDRLDTNRRANLGSKSTGVIFPEKSESGTTSRTVARRSISSLVLCVWPRLQTKRLRPKMTNKRIIYVGVSLSRKSERKIPASAGYRVELSGFLHSKFGSSNLFVRFEIFFRSRKTSQNGQTN